MFDSGELPVDLRWSERASPKVNINESPKDKVPGPAAAQKHWYATEAGTVEQWAVRVARAESAYTTLDAVDESMQSCCDKAA